MRCLQAVHRATAARRTRPAISGALKGGVWSAAAKLPFSTFCGHSALSCSGLRRPAVCRSALSAGLPRVYSSVSFRSSLSLLTAGVNLRPF